MSYTWVKHGFNHRLLTDGISSEGLTSVLLCAVVSQNVVQELHHGRNKHLDFVRKLEIIWLVAVCFLVMWSCWERRKREYPKARKNICRDHTEIKATEGGIFWKSIWKRADLRSRRWGTAGASGTYIFSAHGERLYPQRNRTQTFLLVLSTPSHGSVSET